MFLRRSLRVFSSASRIPEGIFRTSNVLSSFRFIQRNRLHGNLCTAHFWNRSFVSQTIIGSPHSKDSSKIPKNIIESEQPENRIGDTVDKEISGESHSENTDSFIVEINNANFEQFITHSKIPVILDCYANWCEPCRKLTPKLVDMVTKAGGRIRLAKLNVDECKEIAEQLQISSLPTVFGFYNARLIDGFVGMRKDEQIKEFVEKLLKQGGIQMANQYVTQGEILLKNNNIQEAAQLYTELLQASHLKAEAIALAGLARCALAEKNVSAAEDLIAQIKNNYSKDLENPEVKKAFAAVELATKNTQTNPDLKELEEKLAKNPNDLQSRYDLAVVQLQSGNHSEAIEHCFYLIQKEKHWQEDAARKLLLKIFDALGPKDPLVKSGKSRLGSLWFN